MSQAYKFDIELIFENLYGAWQVQIWMEKQKHKKKKKPKNSAQQLFDLYDLVSFLLQVVSLH